MRELDDALYRGFVKTGSAYARFLLRALHNNRPVLQTPPVRGDLAAVIAETSPLFALRMLAPVNSMDVGRLLRGRPLVAHRRIFPTMKRLFPRALHLAHLNFAATSFRGRPLTFCIARE